MALSNDAAGFEPRPAVGLHSFNAAVAWTQELRRAKSRGLRPARALTELSAGG